MEARAARVWMAYQAATWFAFQTSATATAVFLITRLELNALEITLVGTVLEVTVTLCEIPTGVVADTVSRKVSVVIGVALLGFGFLLYAVPSYPVVLLAQVVWGVGYTFTSGADVAWITDEVGEEAARPLYVRGARSSSSRDLRRDRRGRGARGDRVVDRHRRRRGAAAGQRRVAVVPHARDGVRPRRSHASDERGDDDETDRHRRGRHRTHHPTLMVTLGVMALIGLASEGFDRLWHLHILNDIGVPHVGNLAPVVWTGALEAGGLLCAVGLTEIVRRHADIDSDRGVERTAEAVVFGMIVAVVAFGLSRSFWFATIALWSAAAVWEVSEPVLAAWVNRGLDPRTRATVNSLASQAHAVGEVAGGPTFGTIAVLSSTPTALVCAGLVQVPSVVLLARRRRTALRIGRYGARRCCCC